MTIKDISDELGTTFKKKTYWRYRCVHVIHQGQKQRGRRDNPESPCGHFGEAVSTRSLTRGYSSVDGPLDINAPVGPACLNFIWFRILGFIWIFIWVSFFQWNGKWEWERSVGSFVGSSFWPNATIKEREREREREEKSCLSLRLYFSLPLWVGLCS